MKLKEFMNKYMHEDRGFFGLNRNVEIKSIKLMKFTTKSEIPVRFMQLELTRNSMINIFNGQSGILGTSARISLAASKGIFIRIEPDELTGKLSLQVDLASIETNNILSKYNNIEIIFNLKKSKDKLKVEDKLSGF